MENLTQGAAALSTYGLYVICSGLVIVVIHLYKSLNALTVEFRTSLVNQAESVTKMSDDLKALVAQTNNTINANSEVIAEISRVMREK